MSQDQSDFEMSGYLKSFLKRPPELPAMDLREDGWKLGEKPGLSGKKKGTTALNSSSQTHEKDKA